MTPFNKYGGVPINKYGGVPTIRLIVEASYKQVLSRPNLRRYFEGVDMDRLFESGRIHCVRPR